jgi:hypothetical protein
MLRDGGNADEEDQDADDVGLEPQDRIGIHGKLSALGVFSTFAPVTGRTGAARVRARTPSLASAVIPRCDRASNRNL